MSTDREKIEADSAWLRNLAELRFSHERTDIGDRLRAIAEALSQGWRSDKHGNCILGDECGNLPTPPTEGQ